MLGHDDLVHLIALVANQHSWGGVWNPVVLHFFQPGVESNKACHAGDVIHKDNGADVSVVVVGDRSLEPLLACCVP